MKKFLHLILACTLVSTTVTAQQALQLKQMSADNVAKLNKAEHVVAKGKVVTEKQLNKEVSMQIVRNSDGSYHKSLVKSASDITKVLPSAKASVKATESGYKIDESFEGWDGTTSDWVPSDWSRIVSADTLRTVNGGATWHVGSPGMFDPAAADGNYVCSVNMGIEYGDSTVYYDQDEWLISPSFTVDAGEQLYFTAGYTPLFLFNVTTGVDWTSLTFLVKEPSATLQVLIREGEGEWVELLDIYDLYSGYDFATLYENYTDAINDAQTIDLANYVGKTVQVAFRYVGRDGNGISVDAVQVRAPQPVAYYTRPEGAFYFGFSDNYSYLSSGGAGFMLTPAYTDLTWANYSNSEADSYVWTYSDQEGNTVTSDDVHLTVNYANDYESSYNWYMVPSLKASAGSIDSTYQWAGAAIQAGRSAAYNDVKYGVGNYDLNNGFYRLQAAANQPLYGYFDGIDAVWTNMLGTTAHLDGIANYFDKPSRTYLLSKVSVHGIGTFADDAELKLTVISVDDSGNFTDTLAVSTCKGSDIVTTAITSSSSYITIPFSLLDEDGDALEINTALFVVLEGFDNSKTTIFGAFQSGADTNTYETNGYFYLTTSTSRRLFMLSALSTSAGPCYSSFLFDMFIEYPWFEPVDTDVEYDADGKIVYNADAEGELKIFNVESSADSTEKWSYIFNTETGEAPDWLTVSVANSFNGVDVNDGRGQVSFTFAPTTSNEARSVEVLVGIYGAYKTFVLSQNASAGVSVVEKNSDIKVVTTSGDFAITAPEDVTYVSIYNVAGQLVNGAQISGSTTVEAQGLGHGVYMLHFNNGEVVKVVK